MNEKYLKYFYVLVTYAVFIGLCVLAYNSSLLVSEKNKQQAFIEAIKHREACLIAYSSAVQQNFNLNKSYDKHSIESQTTTLNNSVLFDNPDQSISQEMIKKLRPKDKKAQRAYFDRLKHDLENCLAFVMPNTEIKDKDALFELKKVVDTTKKDILQLHCQHFIQEEKILDLHTKNAVISDKLTKSYEEINKLRKEQGLSLLPIPPAKTKETNQLENESSTDPIMHTMKEKCAKNMDIKKQGENHEKA